MLNATVNPPTGPGEASRNPLSGVPLGIDGRQIVTDMRPRPNDVLRDMGNCTLQREAYAAGMSISAYLEHQDPSVGYNDGLDAFQRLLKAANIRTFSDPARGIYADLWERFDQNEGTRALAIEWAARRWRAVSHGQDPSTRALYASTDQAAGSVMEPFVNNAQGRYLQLAPAIPLEELVAITTPIVGDAYRAFYLTNDAPNQRFNRVTQGAEVPRARLIGADHTVRLHKYGRALDVTYEILRRQRIDVVGLHIARLAVQAEIDRVAAAIDIFINGDGNANTAATNFNLTVLDPAAVAGTMTAKGWITYKAQWVNPYIVTTVLTQTAGGVQLELLQLGSANIPLLTLTGPGSERIGGLNLMQPQLADNVRLGITADAPVLKLVGFDRRFALERVTEIGSDITEIEKFVVRQTNTIVMTEVEGFVVFDQFACKTLNINA